MAATILPIDTIISDPAIRDGQPIIKGTNLRVVTLISSHLYRGLSPEELATNFALDLGQVYAALAYYYQHKVEIDTEIRQDSAKAESLLAELEHQGKLIRLE
ncbi:MAG: DUF433 domain-containing protein [Anaerolineae bacterium]|nr:DUF433 domain-containing protein [Anaerolineae bacterium]